MSTLEYPQFLVVRLLSDKSFYRPTPYVLGRVEIRTGRHDSPREADALRESAAAYNVDLNFNVAPRTVTIVSAVDKENADDKAAVVFEETLDLLDTVNVGMSEMELSDVGCIRDIEADTVHPRMPRPDRRLAPSPVFHIVPEKFPQVDLCEALLQAGSTDLVQRLARASHWARRARWERNPQLRILHRWFSMEAALKPDRETDIVPEVILVLGFPIGRYDRDLAPTLRAQLHAHPRYAVWRREVLRRLENMRDWRHNTVHSGWRPWDCSEREVRQYDYLAAIGCSHVINFVRGAILAGLTSAQEVREYGVLLVEENDNFINDVHNNIIFSLENPRDEQSEMGGAARVGVP